MKRQEMLLAARDNAEIARDTRWMLPSLTRLGYNEMTLLMEQIEDMIRHDRDHAKKESRGKDVDPLEAFINAR